MTQDDQYMLKWKSAGIPDRVICAKLGLTPETLRKRVEEIFKELANNQVNGYNDLCDRFQLLAAQYQLVGESLKVFSEVISNQMKPEELLLLVKDRTPEQILEALQRQAIVLRPYVPPDPEKPVEHDRHQKMEKEMGI